jgi:aspartate/methionine/tyrosine aminotransferase
MLDRVNKQMAMIKPSGIRQFAELASKTKGVVSLTIGEPEFNTDDRIKQGIMPLRLAIGEYETKVNQHRYKPSEIIITNGATGGLSAVFLALLNAGDEVIIPSPMYVMYASMIHYCQAKVIKLDTTSNQYQIDQDSLKALITSKTKMIVITSPNNPTGAVLSQASLDAVAEVALQHRLFVLSDDVYQQLSYIDCPKLCLNPLLRSQLIVAQSFSKPYAMTGFRIGYILADEPIAKVITTINSYLVTGISTFIQIGAIKALEVDASDMRVNYQKRRDACFLMLQDMRLPCVKPEGAFYLFPDISEFKMDSLSFCYKALQDYHVAIVPGVFFDGEHHIRISYAVNEEDLYEGMRRLAKMIKDLRQDAQV